MFKPICWKRAAVLHRYLSRATERKRASSSVCETIRRGKSRACVARVRRTADPRNHATRICGHLPVSFKRALRSAARHYLPDSNGRNQDPKEKREERITGPLPLKDQLALVLRQRFDVEKELEAARLLNANRKRTSTEAPFAIGVASVYTPADIDELKPPPFGCDGGCSSVVP